MQSLLLMLLLLLQGSIGVTIHYVAFTGSAFVLSYATIFRYNSYYMEYIFAFSRFYIVPYSCCYRPIYWFRLNDLSAVCRTCLSVSLCMVLNSHLNYVTFNVDIWHVHLDPFKVKVVG